MPPDTSYADDLTRAARAWVHRDREQPPALDLWPTETVGIVKDTRPMAVRPTHVLHGDSLRVYLACDHGSREDHVARSVGLPVAKARDELRRLRDLGLVVELDERWLGLAVCRRRAQPPVRASRTALPLLR